MLPPPPRRPELEELLEIPGQPAGLVRASYRDIRAVNRRLGGLRALRRDLAPLIDDVPPAETLRVLDIATGSGDAAEEIERRAGSRAAVIVGLDLHPVALAMAREGNAHTGKLAWVRGDALRLPFSDGAFHLAWCGLTAHHLGREGAITLMREMDRVTTRGWILNDLRRHWIAWVAISILTRLFTRNPCTRYDGPVSVLRSFTLDEMRDLAREAGFPDAAVEPRFAYRLCVSRRKEAA